MAIQALEPEVWGGPLETMWSFRWRGGHLNHPKQHTATAKSLQSCPTLCDPIDGSPPGSPVPEILQARTRVGCHFLLQCMKVKSLSRVRPSATPWTATFQAPPSMGFSRQEYWSLVPLPSPTNSIEWAPVSQTIREDNVICVSLWI